MCGISHQPEFLYSDLCADPDLRPIVEMFVEEMSGRIENLLGQCQASNWEALRRTAHQLKGAAGSYGFDPITPYAARVEDAAHGGEPAEEIRRAVEALVEMCRRVRAVAPGE